MALLSLFTVPEKKSIGQTAYTPNQADPILEHWRWQRIEALEDVGAVSMCETAEGDLWIGGNNCIARYDGTQVEKIVFDEQLLSILPPTQHPKWARTIHAKSNTEILTLVGNALITWKAGKWDILIPDVGRIAFKNQLIEGEDGVVWFFSINGLWKISSDLTRADPAWLMPKNVALHALAIDDKGDLWLIKRKKGGKHTLVHIPLKDNQLPPQEEWSHYPVEIEKQRNIVSIDFGKDGRLWYADEQYQSGLSYFDPKNQKWHTRTDPEGEQNYFSLEASSNGTIWAGGYGQIYKIVEGKGTNYSRQKTTLPAVPISQITELADGRFCVIENLGSVYIIDVTENRWLTYEGLHFQCEDINGDLWFIEEDDAIIRKVAETGEWLRYKNNRTIILNPRGLFASSHGLIWAVGSHHGVAAFSVFNGSEWKRYEVPNFARMIWPKAIYETSDGTVWLGACSTPLESNPHAGGALQYRVPPGDDIYLYRHHKRPNFPYHITGFAEVPDGTLWMGRPGIYVHQMGERVATPVEDIPYAVTRDMVTTNDGKLWIAQTNMGVFEKTADGWEQHTSADGLVSNRGSSLLALDDNSILVSTDRGISRYNSDGWLTHAFSEAFAMSPSYGQLGQSSDGAIWMNFREEDTRSAQTFLNLERAFCTVRYIPEKNPPNTHIDSRVETVAQPGDVHIEWNGVDPWDQTPPNRLQYSYRLNDGEWSTFSHETRVSFLNLNGGAHSLHVRARDRDFNIDPSPAVIHFDVAPPSLAAPLVCRHGPAHHHRRHCSNRPIHLLSRGATKSTGKASH